MCVYIPEYVVGHWWEQPLHNQTALMIRTRLHFMSNVMVTSVPFQLRSSENAEERYDRFDPLAWHSGDSGAPRPMSVPAAGDVVGPVRVTGIAHGGHGVAQRSTSG